MESEGSIERLVPPTELQDDKSQCITISYIVVFSLVNIFHIKQFISHMELKFSLARAVNVEHNS